MTPSTRQLSILVLRICSALLVCFLCLTADAASARDRKTTTGEFIVDRPTLISLGFEWKIQGDANRNAKVEVEYRKQGESRWHPGLPLFRLQNELLGTPPPGSGPYATDQAKGPAPNAFAGSIFNLEPDTTYEARFTLSDPDGVSGAKVKTATVHTRAEPKPALGGHVYNVYPPGYQGPKQEPAFTGLMSAYYMGASASDHVNSFRPRVGPGDIILVHAGLYKDCEETYVGCHRGQGTEFDNTYYLTQSGTPDKPIVIKGAGDGEAIFDGNGNAVLFDVTAANYNYFEGITVRNTDVAFLIGRKDIVGSSGFTLKDCRIENVGRGVHGDWSGSKDEYIADNVFIGRRNPDRLTSWIAPDLFSKFPGYPERINGPEGSEYAIKIYGQGHVVAYNRVVAFHDGIDVATYGDPDGAPNFIEDRFPASMDIYGNDVTNMGDNCFETDGGGRNIRLFRNRCFNSAEPALSAQPAVGGPIYIFQNLIYNCPTGSLKFTSSSSGVLAYQNTIIGDAASWGGFSNLHYLNNLILGQGATPEWAPKPRSTAPVVFSMDTYTSYSSSDYNGFRPNPDAPVSFVWIAPAQGELTDYKSQRVKREFKTLAEYSQATGQDRHSIVIDYDTFVKASEPDRSDPSRIYKPDEFDFRLKPDSKAIDAGVVLPNLNDDFTGKAPDLGAYESGRPIPHYGPRPVESANR
jgi:hypothetical protein